MENTWRHVAHPAARLQCGQKAWQYFPTRQPALRILWMTTEGQLNSTRTSNVLPAWHRFFPAPCARVPCGQGAWISGGSSTDADEPGVLCLLHVDEAMIPYQRVNVPSLAMLLFICESLAMVLLVLLARPSSVFCWARPLCPGHSHGHGHGNQSHAARLLLQILAPLAIMYI